MEISELCKVLDWDTHFFQKTIAQLATTTLTEDVLSGVLSWCKERSVDCLYFLADNQDPGTLRLVETQGFHLVDVRMTYDMTISPQSVFLTEGSVRSSCEEDIPALRKVTAFNHRETRFYFDGHFPLERCEELYAIWIEKSCRGYADQVFVLTSESEPAGYITCRKEKGATGSIGLFGLHPDFQGKGLGRALLNQALFWFNSMNVQTVNVVTQGRNIQAQRFYQKSGFRTSNLQLWYHRWFS